MQQNVSVAVVGITSFIMSKLIKNLKVSCNMPLSPSYNCLTFSALMKNNRWHLYITMHMLAFIFIITQYIELWIIRSDLELAMRNLSVTMLSTVCVFKAGTFVFWQKSWSELINYVSTLEKNQLLNNDQTTKTIIMKYTKYSRSINYFYRVLVTATVFLVILAPLFSFLSSSEYRDMIRNGSIPYPEIMSSWVPFDRSRGYGYWAASLLHAVTCFYGGSIVSNFDCNAIVIMSFFAGQLNLLNVNCEQMFGNVKDKVNYDEALKRIKDCHYHHLYLAKYSSVLNSLLSPVMFLYVIICSLMICASAIQLTREGTGNMQRIWIAEYLIALIAQLFLFCWHSNEVWCMSCEADRGIYSSIWYTQDVRIRRNLVLLGGQLQRTSVFTAGPFTTLNLAIFVAILKASYSYFTILHKKED